MDYFDILLAKKLNGGGGGDITIEDLYVNENGTVIAPSGKAFGKVVTNVPAPSNALFKQTLSNLPSPIATFTGADAPLDSLKASIVGVQSGSDDPSPTNVRPLTGWSSCEVTRTGKNLCNKETFNRTNTIVYTPLYVGVGDFVMSTNCPPTGDGQEYYRDVFFLSGKVETGASSPTNGVINSTPVVAEAIDGWVTVASRYNPVRNDPADYNWQIERGTTPTAFEPFGNTYTIPFKDSSDNPINVYRGTIDITTGIAIFSKIILSMELLPWRWESSRNAFRVTKTTMEEAGLPPKANGIVNIISSVYPMRTDEMTDKFISQSSTTSNIFLKDSDYDDDLTGLINFITGKQIAYELETPIVINFDPLALRSDGVTNISVDCGEVTECKYYSDTP